MSTLSQVLNNDLLAYEYALATGVPHSSLIKKIEETGLHGRTLFNTFLDGTTKTKRPIDWLDYEFSLEASISGLRFVTNQIENLETYLSLTFKQVITELKHKHNTSTLAFIFDLNNESDWSNVTKGEIIPLLKEFDFWCEFIDDLEISEHDIDSAFSLNQFLNNPLFNQFNYLYQIVETHQDGWEFDKSVIKNILSRLTDSSTIDVSRWVDNAQWFNHYNIVTKKEYSSFYSWLCLTLVQQAKGYKSIIWGSKRQWEKLGYSLKANAMACPVFQYFNTRDLLANEHKDTINIEPSRFGKKVSLVYNSEEVVGFTGEPYINEKVSSLDIIDKRIKELNITIRHGVEAYYDVVSDYICLPSKELFKEKDATESYYATLLHEMVHWTGHPTRLNRKRSESEDDYIFEELVAELGSAFLCTRFQLTKITRQDSINYLNSYLQGLEKEEQLKLLENAARAAAYACNYIYLPKRDNSPKIT